MKTDKEILAINIDTSLSNERRLKYYKSGYEDGFHWAYPDRPVRTVICSHAYGLIDGWRDGHPEQRLKEILLK